MAHLFTPLKLGPYTLRNRIVRAPLQLHTTAPGGFITNAMIDTYTSWARGGVGLVLTEPFSVARSAPRHTPGIYSDVLTPDLHLLHEAVHSNGSILLPVLHHPAAPPAQLEHSEIDQIIERFESAAWRARAAGFKGVIINGADGGLLHQLSSPLTNRRSDGYGGADRSRSAIELVEQLRKRFGPHFLIGYRLIVDELQPNGITLQESRVAARRLAAVGVGLLDVVVSDHGTQPVAHFPGWQIPLAAAIRAVVDVPVIVNGGLGDPELAESVLAEGSADLIGLGETLNRDPRWAEHAAHVFQATQAAS